MAAMLLKGGRRMMASKGRPQQRRRVASDVTHALAGDFNGDRLEPAKTPSPIIRQADLRTVGLRWTAINRERPCCPQGWPAKGRRNHSMLFAT